VLTGRVKDLINRGGEKIAPAEVEAALRRHPVVAEAAAFAVPHPRLEEAVAAAVVLTARARSTGREIRREAARYLAPHKLPRQVWLVAALPRTPTGKVRRDDLQRQFGGPGAPADAVE
jgi:acyl-coenzyme A synthetase/AMP-(fatty) acid ligase